MRFEATGTGLNTCQQSAQMAHMDRYHPELLNGSEVALHCKDWLYLNLTGVRATDPSEASFTFGNFRTRRYDDNVIAARGWSTAATCCLTSSTASKPRIPSPLKRPH